MLKQKVKESFEKYPDLRVLFLFDQNGDHLLEANSWDDNSIVLIKVERNYFSVKYQIEYELKNKKVFLYFNYPKPDESESKLFGLMDLLVANRELYIDDVEEFIQEYGLKPYQRDTVKRYITYLKVKKNQKTLSKILKPDTFEEKDLKIGLISCFLKSSSIDGETVVLIKIFLLLLSNQEEFDTFTSKIKEIDAESILCRYLYDYFEIETPAITKDKLLLCLRTLKYNMIIQNIDHILPTDNYSKLKIHKANKIHLLNSLYHDWLNEPKLSESIEEVLNSLVFDVNEDDILKVYGIDTDYGLFTEKLAITYLAEFSDIIEINPDKAEKYLKEVVLKIPNHLKSIKIVIELLRQCASIYKVINSVTNYILDNPKDYIEEYITQYQYVDYSYRKALLLIDELRIHELPPKLNIEGVVTRIHSAYEEYIKELNTEWLKCIKDHEYEFNNIPVQKQYKFYDSYVKGTDQKIAVIISDGLRYEAGKELLDKLHTDPKHQAEIGYMLTSLPSYTKLGMANLLPSKEISFNDDLVVIDGQSTEGIGNREAILQKYDPDSRAIQYEKLVGLPQEEARELFKSKIVYIYHNVIDAIGDDKKSEKQTIHAVERAIAELTPLIKKIHSSYNVANIIVTADHGFLYNPIELPESMYEALPDKNAFINHNRFSIVAKPIQTNSYIFDLSKASKIKTDYKITIPKAINRYKRQGHGVLYVHGGASLQEMIVPVIESTRKREDVVEKVQFKLLNKEFKIVSSAIKLKFIQEKAVGKEYTSISLICGLFTDTDELLSSEVRVVLDSKSELPTQRTKELILNLLAKAKTTSIIYLKIFDEEKDPNKLNPLIKEMVLNQTLIQSEF